MMTQALPDSRVFTLPPVAKIRIGGGLDATFANAMRVWKRLVVPYQSITIEGAMRSITKRANSGDIVSGHLSVKDFALQGWVQRRITLLRHPVDRFISEYKYNRQGFASFSQSRKILNVDQRSIAGRGSLDDFVSWSWERRAGNSNFVCQMVAGHQEMDSAFRFLREEYFHFGVLEDIEGFAAQLSEKLGVQVDTLHLNKSVNRNADGVNRKLISRIEQMFDQDLALYEAVKDHLSLRAH